MNASSSIGALEAVMVVVSIIAGGRGRGSFETSVVNERHLILSFSYQPILTESNASGFHTLSRSDPTSTEGNNILDNNKRRTLHTTKHEGQFTDRRMDTVIRLNQHLLIHQHVRTLITTHVEISLLLLRALFTLPRWVQMISLHLMSQPTTSPSRTASCKSAAVSGRYATS